MMTKTEKKVKLKPKVTQLVTPPPVDKKKPPPPPPPPVKPQVKFTPPVIKKAEEVKEEEKPPPKKELEKATASTQTIKGDPDAKLDAPIIPDKGPAVVEPAKPEPPKNEIFEFVEQMPEFPGGEDAMMAYIQKNMKYPKAAVENSTEGRVIVNFVVNDDGNIVDVKTVRGIGSGCDQEAERVVRSMPAWKAGKQNGKPVRVSYSLPITFQLE